MGVCVLCTCMSANVWVCVTRTRFAVHRFVRAARAKNTFCDTNDSGDGHCVSVAYVCVDARVCGCSCLCTRTHACVSMK